MHSIEKGRHSFEDAIITNIQCLIKYIAINDLTKELPLQEQVGTALEIALKAHRGQREMNPKSFLSNFLGSFQNSLMAHPQFYKFALGTVQWGEGRAI